MKAYCCCWSSLQQPTKYKKRNPNGVQRSVTYFLYSPICILQVVGENSNNNKSTFCIQLVVGDASATLSTGNSNNNNIASLGPSILENKPKTKRMQLWSIPFGKQFVQIIIDIKVCATHSDLES